MEGRIEGVDVVDKVEWWLCVCHHGKVSSLLVLASNWFRLKKLLSVAYCCTISYVKLIC